MSSVKDMIAQAVFTTAVDRLTKAAKKNGVDEAEASGVFAAVLQKHYPAKSEPLRVKP